MIRIFDTHAHYDDNVYDEDRDQLFKRMLCDDVTDICLIGANYENSKSERDLALKYNAKSGYPKFYYTVGDHPDEIEKYSPSSKDGVEYLGKLESLCKDDSGKVIAVAIGEIGIDYHGDFKTEEDFKNQKEWFMTEIELAKKLNLPLAIHSRDACKDTFDVIKENAKGMSGIIHCFSYEKEIAIEYIKLGFYIGIGGTVTFKNARKVKEVVEAIPIESIVTETDAPWLSPTPYRGKRNESSYIKYVIEEIAKLKHMDIEETAHILYENAKKVYCII